MNIVSSSWQRFSVCARHRLKYNWSDVQKQETQRGAHRKKERTMTVCLCNARDVCICPRAITGLVDNSVATRRASLHMLVGMKMVTTL